MELVPSKEHTRVRQAAGDLLLLLSRLSFGTAFILAPFRYRWLLQSNPIPPIFVEYTNLYYYPADVFLLLTLFLWLFSLLFSPKTISLEPRWLTFALGGLVAVTIVSSFTSIDPQLSHFHSIRMVMLFGVYIYLINAAPSFVFAAAAAGIQLLIQSAIGIAQVLRQHSLGLTNLKELLLDPAANGISIVWVDGLRSLRAYGLTDHPNILGGCLAFSLILLGVMYVGAKLPWRPWIGSLCFLGAIALLLTFSRAAWVGMLVGMILLSAWLVGIRNRKGLLDLARLGGLTALLLIPFLWGYAPLIGTRMGLDGSFQGATPENQSVNERALLNIHAEKMITEYPLTGVGIGTFPEALLLQEPQYPFTFQPPHMVLMHVAAEIGLPGAGLYLFVMVAPWIFLFYSRRKSRPSLPLIGASAGLLAIGVVSLLDYYPWLLNPGRIWQWSLWGLWAAYYQSSINWKYDA